MIVTLAPTKLRSNNNESLKQSLEMIMVECLKIVRYYNFEMKTKMYMYSRL